MFLSTAAFFENHIPGNNMLLIRAETALPAEFVKRYKANAVAITPRKTGALRRSIITQQLGASAQVSWRSAYAGAQNQGFHTVTSRRVVNIDGRFVTLMPGIHRYSRYTTPGTGAHFANIAYAKTVDEMPAVIRELGLTK